MGFIHYNNTIEEQLANVVKVKRHIPGFVVTPATLPPTATIADIEKLRVRLVGWCGVGGDGGRWL
jgi:IMP dehydrogenase